MHILFCLICYKCFLFFFVLFFYRLSPADVIGDCLGVRRRAYAVFNSDVILNYVGMYGNSDPANISQWLRIINESVDANDKVYMLTLGHEMFYILRECG